MQKLQKLLNIVERFARTWRISFTHPDPKLTKSHCLVFGASLLSSTPVWMLCNQRLDVKTTSVHLGVTMDACLQGSLHTENRIKRARGAFYAMTPAGILSSRLSPSDKVFLWRTVALPALLFGCEVAPLRAADVQRLEKCQASCLKAALGLPQYAHHTALLIALGVPTIRQLLREGVLRTLRSSFRDDHRLRQALVRAIGEFTRRPSSLGGSFVGLAADLCGGHLETLLNVTNGCISRSLVSAPSCADGIADSIKTAAEYPEPLRSTLLFLLCKPF